MSNLLQDLRYAARLLLRSPGFTIVAVSALALGIGANAAIFSVVKAVLLAPPPFQDPDRLVRLWQSSPEKGEPIDPLSPGSYAAYRDESGVFEATGAASDGLFNLTGDGEPEALMGYRFSADFFRVLGVPALLGRTFLPEEDRAGAEPVAILSYDLWQRRYSGDPHVVGRRITLDGRSHTVVGVMPREFKWGSVLVWVPLALDPALADDHSARFLRVVARLEPGVSRAQAQSAVEGVARRLAEQRPADHSGWTALVEPIGERMVGSIRPALLALTVAVGFVLLIACANVANLLLVRASAREREVAVRVALGASRGRLVRLCLAESLLLGLLGGLAGLLLTNWTVDLLLALFPKNLGNVAIPRLHAIHVDGGVLLFALVLSLAASLIFGLAPALRLAPTRMADALRSGGRAGAGPGRTRLREVLVIVEVALALVLVAGASLLLRSFSRLQAGSLGFDPDHVLTMRVMLPEGSYDAARQRAFLDAALVHIRRLPGVEAVGASTYLPVSGWYGKERIAVRGQTPAPPGQEPEVDYRVIAGDYLQALRVRLVRGRLLAESDGEGAPPVVLVNETFARRFLGAGEPIGQAIEMRLDSEQPPRWREVVGVVSDLRHHGLAEPPSPEVYLPFRQEPLRLIGFAVRTSPEPMSLAAAVRAAIWEVDPDQPVSHVLTLGEMAADTVTLRRASVLLLLTFAALALGLACLGLYGVMAQAVAQRTQEIGVRLALGASPGDVRRMIVGAGLRTAGVGLALGLLASFGVSRLLTSLLYGVSPTDPASLAATAAILGGTAFLASGVAALRAGRIDPLRALRHE